MSHENQFDLNLQLQLFKYFSLILVKLGGQCAFLSVTSMSCMVRMRQTEIFSDANHFSKDSKITEEEKSEQDLAQQLDEKLS